MHGEKQTVTDGVVTVEDVDEQPDLATSLGIGRATRVKINDPLVAADPDGERWLRETMSKLLTLIDDRRPGRDQEDPEVSGAFFGLSDALARWRSDIPSAAALHPLYEPLLTLGDGSPLDTPASRVFTHSLDGRGIRSRGAVLSWLLSSGGLDGSWASLACGAARPVCTALVAEQRAGRSTSAAVLDWDADALLLAEATATSLGVADRVTTHRVNVLKASAVRDIIDAESCSSVECLGFFEYLPVRESMGRVDAAGFMALAYSLVAEGGQLVFANMLDTHPELPFTMHAVRWPMIVPRNVDEILRIVDMAGISRSAVELWLPEDGVYAVVRVLR